jgi:hypothetical protein
MGASMAEIPGEVQTSRTSAADWSVALQLAPLGLELSAEHARFILTF